MRIAILTSSRADYGIYLPLLRMLQGDKFFDLHIIAFGTHLSHFHGHTIDQIENDGFTIDHLVETVLAADSESAITTSIALTQMKFAEIWASSKDRYDLVFALGDRYEMFAAVAASVPFNIKIAHIHGGETTLGAIDNIFRHCITQMSHLHFVTTSEYAVKVSQLKGSSNNVHNTGSLSLANIQQMELFSKAEFKTTFGIDIDLPTILVTFHPETVSSERNLHYVKEVIRALNKLNEQIVITMPNADTMGNVMRKEYEAFISKKSNVIGIENFGTKGYFTAMKYSKYLLGNTSSGIIEAASFGKYVVNIGERQAGRTRSGNILEVKPEKMAILDACQKIKAMGEYTGNNIYYNPNAVRDVITLLKTIG